MSLLEQDSRKRLPNGVRKHIRGLKRSGRHEEADVLREKVLEEKSWEHRINRHLGSGNALRQLGDKKVSAVSDWILLRVSMKSGRIREKDYREGYDDFVDRYDGVLDDPMVIKAMKFITEDTKLPEKD
jgi:hypothetical protein